MKDIDYAILVANMEAMINLLEYDSMRSAGKAKLNSQHLHSMLFLVDRYKEIAAKKKPALVKKEG